MEIISDVSSTFTRVALLLVNYSEGAKFNQRVWAFSVNRSVSETMETRMRIDAAGFMLTKLFSGFRFTHNIDNRLIESLCVEK